MIVTELEDLRQAVIDYNRGWVARGGLLTAYECPQCKSLVETPKPNFGGHVGAKGFWDGLKRCVWCGGVNFVSVYPDGRTVVK